MTLSDAAQIAIVSNACVTLLAVGAPALARALAWLWGRARPRRTRPQARNTRPRAAVKASRPARRS